MPPPPYRLTSQKPMLVRVKQELFSNKNIYFSTKLILACTDATEATGICQCTDNICAVGQTCNDAKSRDFEMTVKTLFVYEKGWGKFL